MSFCLLLNAVLLFTGVVTFILAGFAGTFSRRLYGCRYRLMLAPLGFVVAGSLSYSTTTHLVEWFRAADPSLHLSFVARAGLGSGGELFASVVLILAGCAGILTGIALGAAFDHSPAADSTYTIANYWRRQGKMRAGTPPGRGVPSGARKAKVIAMTHHEKHPSPATQVEAIELRPVVVSPHKAVSENE